jgi:hypothetical protein
MKPISMLAMRGRRPISPDTAGFAITLNQVADYYTAIPDGIGTLTNFPYSPAIDGGNVSVYATSVGGHITFARLILDGSD